MAKKDLYDILGVARTASEDEIKSAYRKLARKHHPDVNPGNKKAEERFKEISAAHDVLSDPPTRKLYDEFGEAGLRPGFDADKARAYQSWGGAGGRTHAQHGAHFSEGFGNEFNLGDLFSEIYERRPRARRGRDIEAVVEIDLRQALAGAEVHLDVPGHASPVTVRIPPGADHGSRLRVSGQGGPGSHGAPPGDLVIETRVRPHPYFGRQQLDLTLKLPVTLDEAYNGAQIDVPTPDGSVTLRVPARSQQGTKLRLRGKGVRRGDERGDLYVELDVRLPEGNDERLAEALRQAASAYQAKLREGIAL